MQILLILPLVFLASVFLTAGMIAIGIKDIPNERSSHAKITPKSGGIGVFMAFAASVLGLAWGLPQIFLNNTGILIIVGLLGLVVGFALVDDLVGLPPFQKLCAQMIVAALCFVLFITGNMGSFDLKGFFTDESLYTIALILGFPLVLLWFSGFMNALNFMDGINGLAAGYTLLVTVFFAFVFQSSAPSMSIIMLVFAASVGGFFVWNFPSGKIFLGDTGSQGLGFFLAVCPLFLPNPVWAAYTAVYLLSPLFFDVAFTMVHRRLRGYSLTEAHREHLYQLLVRMGLDHVRVSLIYFAIFGVVAGHLWVFMAGVVGIIIHCIGTIFLLGAGLCTAIMIYQRGLQKGLLPLKALPSPL